MSTLIEGFKRDHSNIVADEDLDKVVQAIATASQTGSVGDGKIFVYDAVDAHRIRTGEQGDVAI